jgi:hypothetical protein
MQWRSNITPIFLVGSIILLGLTYQAPAIDQPAQDLAWRTACLRGI